MIAYDPQGRIFPCIRYMESSLNGEQEPYSIGDVDNGIGCTECYKCRINCMAKQIEGHRVQMNVSIVLQLQDVLIVLVMIIK